MEKQFLTKAAMEETSAVHVWIRYIAELLDFARKRGGSGDQWVDLVNGDIEQQCLMSLRANVTSRDKNLIQPESLILAQSERWRQA